LTSRGRCSPHPVQLTHGSRGVPNRARSAHSTGRALWSSDRAPKRHRVRSGTSETTEITSDKEIVMGLVRTALIFGAGYVLGRPEGRAKVAALGNRPEVAQLRQQAASTVASSVKSGKERLTKATGRAGGDAAEQASPNGNDSGPNTARRGRLPSFPKRGARHAASTATATTSTGSTAQSKPAGTASDQPDAAPVPSTASLPKNGPTT
jgi:hypothetical protein